MPCASKKYNNKLPSEWQFSQKCYKKTQNIMYLTAKRLSIFWRKSKKASQQRGLTSLGFSLLSA